MDYYNITTILTWCYGAHSYAITSQITTNWQGHTHNGSLAGRVSCLSNLSIKGSHTGCIDDDPWEEGGRGMNSNGVHIWERERERERERNLPLSPLLFTVSLVDINSATNRITLNDPTELTVRTRWNSSSEWGPFLERVLTAIPG